MKIRGITEKWHRIFSNYAQHGYTAAVHARDFEEMRDDLASILEELALMEAVCEAASKVEFYTSDDGWERGWLGARETRDAYASLQAYRKERGL